MKDRKRSLSIAVTAGLFLALCWYSGPWSQDKKPKAIPPATANQVVLAIQSGKLKPDAKGIVTLPPALTSASKNGKVYVTKNGPGATIILFPSFVAGGWFTSISNYEGLLYSNLAPPASCEIIGPVLAAPLYTRSGNWTAGQTGFQRDSLVRTGANWYQVATDDF